MPRRSRKKQKSDPNLGNFVVLTYAEDLDHAKDYQALLKENDIPALVKQQNTPVEDALSNIVIMVPEEKLDEAHVIIESQKDYDDFYDFAVDNEDDNFDTDFFDKHFKLR